MTTLSPQVLEALRAARGKELSAERGRFDQICTISGPISVQEILNFVADTLPDEYSDFDKKGRGDCLTHDLYGWCADEMVAVVQVRHSFRQYSNGFLNCHKTYVLCGYNENGTPFRHPVSSAVVRAAVRRGATPRGVVHAAQMWMWGVNLDQLIVSPRQGDILLVEERSKPKGALTERGTEARLADTHVVRSERIVSDEKGRLWALRPVLRHTKGEHADQRSRFGTEWVTVRVAETAAAWNFGQRLGD